MLVIPQGLIDIANCVAYIFSSAGPYEGLEKLKGVVVEFDLWYESFEEDDEFETPEHSVRWWCLGPDQIKVSIPHG